MPTHPTVAAERLFAELIDLDAAQRAVRLAADCADQPALRAEVESLLEAALRGADYLDGLRLRLGLAADAEPGREAGNVGPWRLIRELGSGGMGQVWLAERTDLLQGRQVALKLPHLSGGAWRRSGLAERLAREREILATLEHPNIAQLYDAGITPAGQPWLALEYVAGERIDSFCRARALPVAERLKLFLQVASAVAHAHAQLVVHRDLKPANILVTDRAGVFEVKLLDFGIAKLLQDDAHGSGGAESALTRDAGRPLTPDYASPEQILGQPIGTASDIYSLGLLLFELLAGVHPRRAAASGPAAPGDAFERGDVPRPSALAPAGWRRPLRGDLDTIVLRALKQAPAERYATVPALAEDVQRHLDHRPVLARPDAWAYRAVRFVRRHRGAVATGGAVTAALLAGAALAVWQADAARSEQRRAESVKSFVADLFLDADPYRTTSREPTVAGLLQAAQQRLDGVAGAAPAVRVELLLMIGASHAGLQQFDRAEPLFDQALALARRELGADHDLARQARLSLIDLYRHRGRLAEMKTELDALLPMLRQPRTPVQRELLLQAVLLTAHLAIDEGRYAPARDAAREAVNLSTALHGGRHPATVDAQIVLATALSFAANADVVPFPAALEQAALAHRLTLEVHGEDHAKALDAGLAYGAALHDAGRFGQARGMLETVMRGLLKTLGDEAAAVAYAANDLSRNALELGDETAALRYAEWCLKLHLRQTGPDSLYVALARRQLGRSLLALHRPAAARAEFEHALRVITAQRGADSPLVLNLTALLALAQVQAGQVDEAWRLLAPRMAAFQQTFPGLRHLGLRVAGLVREGQGDLSAAAALQDQALAALPERAGERTRRNILLGERARVALGQGDAAAALAWLDRVVRPEGSVSPSLEDAERQLTRGRALLALGRPAQALEALQQAEAAWQALAPQAPAARAAQRWRALAQRGGAVAQR